MLKKLQQSYDGNNIGTATNGILHFLLEEDCTIKAVSIVTDANATGDIVFNLSKNGTALFAGAGRPKILSGSKSGKLTGLNIAGLEFDKILVDVESIAAGVVDTPITIILTVDDGVSSGGGGGGSSFSPITWTSKVGCVESSDILTNTTGSNGWGTSGAFSVEKISDTGVLRYCRGYGASEPEAMMMGLSHSDPDQSYTSIRYGLLLSSGADIYELGTGRTSFPFTPFDIFEWRIFRNEKKERCLHYLKNGDIMRAIIIIEGDLYVDLAFYGGSASVGKPMMKIGF